MSEFTNQILSRPNPRDEDRTIIGCCIMLVLIVALIVAPYVIAWCQGHQINKLSDRVSALERHVAEQAVLEWRNWQ